MEKSFLERVWEYREEVLYRKLFGDTGPGIYPLTASLFADVFHQSYDPRWLHLGVFACPPRPDSKVWTYVSSGLSNPWDAEGPPDDPSELSWLGVEYVFQTTEPGDWAVQLVQKVVAFDVLLAHDRYEGRGPLSPGDRLPNRGSTVPGRDSKLECILIAQPKDLPLLVHPCFEAMSRPTK